MRKIIVSYNNKHNDNSFFGKALYFTDATKEALSAITDKIRNDVFKDYNEGWKLFGFWEEKVKETKSSIEYLGELQDFPELHNKFQNIETYKIVSK